MNDTIEMLLNHRSIRKYSDKDLSEDIIKTIIASAQMAPTSSHFQAYTIIEVKDRERRKALAEFSGGQPWIEEAPLVLLFCGDLNRGKKYFQDVEGENFEYTEQYTIGAVDAALAAQKGLIAAQSLGLGGVFVGGIRNDVESVNKEFQLPELVYPLFALCIGYPAQDPGIKPRLPMDVIRKIDYYDESKDDQLIKEYDETISRYYEERTNGENKDTWTEHCGKSMKGKSRVELRQFFREIGLLRR